MAEENRLKEAQPEDVALFLKAQGWKLRGTTGFLATWVPVAPRGASTHVLVPLRAHAGDYAALLAKAMQQFADLEGATAREVYDDLLVKYHDTVRVRLEGGVHDLGRARLGEAAEMVTGVKTLFYAGAGSVEKKVPVLQGRSNQAVANYLDSLEIATEPGSFVVKVFAPLAPRLDEFKVVAGQAKDPFSRIATTNVVRSVDAVVRAAQEARKRSSMDSFRQHIDEGVTANLCEALASIAISSPLVSVSVSASWAVSRPGPPESVRKAVVPADLVSLIEQAAPILRGKRPEDPVTIVGLVFLLKEEKKAGVHAVGLGNTLPEGPRKVRVSLSQPQYKRAIEAHQVDALVRVVGRVRRSGSVFYIDEPIEFDIIGQLPPNADPAKPDTRRLDSF